MRHGSYRLPRPVLPLPGRAGLWGDLWGGRARLEPVLECVANVSEGRDRATLDDLSAAGGPCLLDLHHDPDHNRAVITLAGPGVEEAVRAVAALAVARLDLGHHLGAHPRLGVVDVVPFVPLGHSPMTDAVAARDRFATWAAATLRLPCFLYGPPGTGRSLPEIRRLAFAAAAASAASASGLAPDTGPQRPHPTAGAACVGARGPLVAYNLWLGRADLDRARAVARSLRGPALRALGLDVGGTAQVSCNLVSPLALGPAQAYDAVAALVPVARAELVGLVPAAVLARVPERRWAQLDLGPDRTIESRLARAGFPVEPD